MAPDLSRRLGLEPLPDFVLRALPDEGFGVPALLYHWVHPDEFSRHLDWLADAGYRTLTADEALAVVAARRPCPRRAVLLTFDDGVYNNWAVAAPLLRRRGMHAVAFVVPRLLGDGPRRPTLDDSDAGRIPRAAVLDDRAAGRWLNWEEAVALDAEGVIEIQSHTYDHAQVFTSDTVIDFQHPLADGSPRYPWLWSAAGTEPATPLWGAPVYPTAPRMCGRRYHDDPAFRDACRRFVDVRGGRGLFSDVTWRAELRRFARHERRRFAAGRLETPAECAAERLRSLAAARQMLGERLARPIDHLALPWSRMGEDSLDLVRRAGYRSAYVRQQASFRLRPGADPLALARLEGYWVESLPGANRLTLATRLRRRLAARLAA